MSSHVGISFCTTHHKTITPNVRISSQWCIILHIIFLFFIYIFILLFLDCCHLLFRLHARLIITHYNDAVPCICRIFVSIRSITCRTYKTLCLFIQFGFILLQAVFLFIPDRVIFFVEAKDSFASFHWPKTGVSKAVITS